MVTPVCVEPLLGYHPCILGFLTSRRDPAVDNARWEFGWGGRLRKGIGGAQRNFPQNGRKPFEECKGRRELGCDTDGWSRYESRA